MDYPITRTEFEALPFRDDVTGDYVQGKDYRAKAYPNMIFRFVGTPHRPDWWAFRIELVRD